jgi:serine/threonine protein kinase
MSSTGDSSADSEHDWGAADPGRRPVPGYLVEELAGVGATGEVWRARRRDTGDVVALKRIVVHDAGVLRAARSEAALLAAFDHPHILRLHELLVQDGEAVLVLEFAEGGSLAEVLAHRGKLSAGEVVTIIAPIASALAAAHAEGVIHGDVSPANILFTADGRPLLADLGVARLIGVDGGAVRATPGYLDPLVAAGGAPGPHSDVFMLAAVAWHALTGAPPWAGATVLESLGLAAQGHLPSIAQAAPTIPMELAEALDRALQMSAHLRGSAAELALDSRHSTQPIPVDGWTGRRSPADATRTRSRPAGRHCAPEQLDAPELLPRPDVVRAAGVFEPIAGRPTFRRPGDRGDQSAEPPSDARTRLAHRPAAIPLAPKRSRWRRGRSSPAVRPATVGSAAGPADPRRPAVPDALGPHRVGPNPRGQHGARRLRRRGGVLALVVAAGLASISGGMWWAHADVSGGGEPQALSPSNAVLTSSLLPGAQTPLTAPPNTSPSNTSPSNTSPSNTSPSNTSPSNTSPSSSAPSSPSAASSAPVAPSPETRWMLELTRLDAVRAQAYAENRPDLLVQVYRPGPLLDEDAAQLRLQVPTGCGLHGAVTAYSQLEVGGSGLGSVSVAVTAALPSASLMCAGVLSGRSSAIAPTRLQISLSAQSDGTWRISQQRRG